MRSGSGPPARSGAASHACTRRRPRRARVEPTRARALPAGTLTRTDRPLSPASGSRCRLTDRFRSPAAVTVGPFGTKSPSHSSGRATATANDVSGEPVLRHRRRRTQLRAPSGSSRVKSGFGCGNRRRAAVRSGSAAIAGRRSSDRIRATTSLSASGWERSTTIPAFVLRCGNLSPMPPCGNRSPMTACRGLPRAVTHPARVRCRSRTRSRWESCVGQRPGMSLEDHAVQGRGSGCRSAWRWPLPVPPTTSATAIERKTTKPVPAVALVPAATLADYAGQAFVLSVSSAFIVAFLITFGPLPQRARNVALVAGPLADFGVFGLLLHRSPPCTTECWDQAVAVTLAGFALLAWLVGAVAGYVLRKAVAARRPPTPSGSSRGTP